MFTVHNVEYCARLLLIYLVNGGTPVPPAREWLSI